jgi:hypothetical protein
MANCVQWLKGYTAVITAAGLGGSGDGLDGREHQDQTFGIKLFAG